MKPAVKPLTEAPAAGRTPLAEIRTRGTELTAAVRRSARVPARDRAGTHRTFNSAL
ncbi:hypothetical protein [Streptomyces sp. t39]|uniref:hypothetical protein n=1 Tax=Streptomyces sp. t39 TaxID=1828156 RepID=UPI0021C86A6B|nr:hypothetical protein [Streptomyces sp. t39]